MPMWYDFLIDSVENNDMIEVKRHIEEENVDLNKIYGNRDSPLAAAADYGHEEMVKLLCELGADPNFSMRNDSVHPLSLAAAKNYVGVIRILAKFGADINATVCDGSTAAIIAAHMGHVESIVALGELGADMNIAKDDGGTPASMAARKGHCHVLLALKEFGVDLNKKLYFGTTLTHVAAGKGHVEVVKLLLEMGAEVNAADDNGYTPLLFAASHGNVDLITTLIDFGADVHLSGNGTTALIYAAAEGAIDAVQVLLDIPANVDKRADDGDSALIAAVDEGFNDVAELLVSYGADVSLCLRNYDPRDVEHIWNMVNSFRDAGGLAVPRNRNDDCEHNIICKFSVTKLIVCCSLFKNVVDNNLCDLTETDIAIGIAHFSHGNVFERIQVADYILKTKIVRMAWKIYISTIELDGGRLKTWTKTQRYLEIFCFLFDIDMLRSVLSLRMTCKSNNYRSRFPVFYKSYRELEAYIIEEWIAYSSSRFVSTGTIVACLGMHDAA